MKSIHHGLNRLLAFLVPLFLFGVLAAMQAHAHGGDGAVNGNVSSVSSASVSGYVSGTGLSLQGAYNQGNASINGGAVGTGVGLGPLKAVTASTWGEAATTNTSLAGGLTLGNATGTHDAAGLSQASLAGQASGHTVANGPAAVATGNAETITGTQVTGNGTGLGAVVAGTKATFDAGGAATQVKVGPFNTIETDSHALGSAIGSVSMNFGLGGTSTLVDNQGAFNAFGQSKAGLQQSTN